MSQQDVFHDNLDKTRHWLRKLETDRRTDRPSANKQNKIEISQKVKKSKIKNSVKLKF